MDWQQRAVDDHDLRHWVPLTRVLAVTGVSRSRVRALSTSADARLPVRKHFGINLYYLPAVEAFARDHKKWLTRQRDEVAS